MDQRFPAFSQPAVLLRLYISHSLSSWNSRMFEFGAILFLASTFPGTLLYASSYALLRALAAVLFSSRIGAYVDGTNRLIAIRNSIIWQRIPVALSCAVFLILLTARSSKFLFWFCFPSLVILAGFEKLAAVGNTVAIERDWTVVISESTETTLQDLNAILRRIDLICKLVAPVFISFVAAYSTKIAIIVVMAMNTFSTLGEYIAIARVYHAVPKLAIKVNKGTLPVSEIQEMLHSSDPGVEILPPLDRSPKTWIIRQFEPWVEYFISPVFLASFSLSMLYLTVLSPGVQYQTYMLSAGYSAVAVSFLRVTAVVSELTATCFAPLLMSRIGHIRAGLWSINWQVTWCAAAVGAFVYFDNMPILAGAGLTAGIVMSRLGLWGFDLSVQEIVQELTPEATRGQFSSSEVALQNFFELLSFASTIVFARPDQFRYPIFISSGAISISAACFAWFVRQKRGHLLHSSKCMQVRGKYSPVTQMDLEELENRPEQNEGN